MSTTRPQSGIPRQLDLRPRLSRLAAKVPAGGRLGEFLRRRHAGSGMDRWLQDFDGDDKFRVDLPGHTGGQTFWNGNYAVDILALADRLLAARDTVLDIGVARTGYSPREWLACIAYLGYAVSNIGRNGTLGVRPDPGTSTWDALCVPA